MSYLSNLKTEANYTRTLNGAKTHGSTGDACLDFFAVAGGMRYRRPADQINLFERAYIETPDLAMKLLFHIPNGGKRDKVTAARLKAQGVKAGVPDLFLPVARHGKHGLWIELKIYSGKPSLNQCTWIGDLREHGYDAFVCYGWEDSKGVLEAYLS